MRALSLFIVLALAGGSPAEALPSAIDAASRPAASVGSDGPSADDAFVLVAPRGTPAFDVAESRANGSTVFAERKLWRALQRAAELVNEGGERTVAVLIAQGDYDGEFGVGIQRVPRLDNPDASLRIFGGMNDDFSGRQPFAFPVRIPTVAGRDGAIFQIEGRSKVRELIVSGLILDAAPSNDYDARTNSLLKATSRNYPVFAFAYSEVERLVIADNVILNGASGGFQIGSTPPRGAAGEVIIQNNFFLNNLLALRTRTFGARAGAPYERLTVRNNSFILNFPYNPDPTSSNVSAIEWHNSNSFEEMVFEGNLFAYNPGGVFQSDWEQQDLPAITLRDNLFYVNGALWGESEPEAAVVAGKFGSHPTYRVLDLYDVEDDLDADFSGNVSFDPQLPIALSALQAVDSGGVEAQVSVLNDVRQLFGINTDGGTVEIANFAPQMSYDLRAIPLPQNPEAQRYGVQPTQTWGSTQ